jgi:hypothetical protein
LADVGFELGWKRELVVLIRCGNGEPVKCDDGSGWSGEDCWRGLKLSCGVEGA